MPFLVIIAVVILGAGIVANIASPNSSGPDDPITTSVTSTPIPTSSPTPIPTIQQSLPTPTIKPVNTINPTNIVNPTQITQPANWQYPNSQKRSENEFVSSESPEKITQWYKDKIIATGYSSKSFVQTSTNAKILNKLVGAKQNNEISVEIYKNPEDANTTIKIALDN